MTQEDCQKTVFEHLYSQRPKLALQFMLQSNNLDVYPPKLLLRSILMKQQEKDCAVCDQLVSAMPDLSSYYIQLLKFYKFPSSCISTRTEKFSRPTSSSSGLNLRKLDKTIQYLVGKKAYHDLIDLVQEAPIHRQTLSEMVCRHVIRYVGKDSKIAQQFVYRLGSGASFPHVDITQANITALPPRKPFHLRQMAQYLSISDLSSTIEIVWIQSEKQLSDCMEYIAKHVFIGIDIEWKPKHAAHVKSASCALIQVACHDKVFLIDAIAMRNSTELIVHFLSTLPCLVLGFAVAGDVENIRKHFCIRKEEWMPSLVDLEDLERAILKKHSSDDGSAALSLNSLVSRYLGKPLDKRARTSNWEMRPLSKTQIHYAALDALVLVHVLSKMRNTFGKDFIGSLITEHATNA